MTIFVPSGTSYAVPYSTLWGGNDVDIDTRVVLGPGGAVYLTINSQSTDLTTTTNAVKRTSNGSYPGYLATPAT